MSGCSDCFIVLFWFKYIWTFGSIMHGSYYLGSNITDGVQLTEIALWGIAIPMDIFQMNITQLTWQLTGGLSVAPWFDRCFVFAGFPYFQHVGGWPLKADLPRRGCECNQGGGSTGEGDRYRGPAPQWTLWHAGKVILLYWFWWVELCRWVGKHF